MYCEMRYMMSGIVALLWYAMKLIIVAEMSYSALGEDYFGRSCAWSTSVSPPQLPPAAPGSPTTPRSFSSVRAPLRRIGSPQLNRRRFGSSVSRGRTAWEGNYLCEIVGPEEEHVGNCAVAIGGRICAYGLVCILH
jgi:hypothetical protein